MAPFLLRLLPALGQFTAVVFTNKSTYHLPSTLPDFTEIVRISTRRTAHALPSCFSLPSNMDTGGVLGPPAARVAMERMIRGKKARNERNEIGLCLILARRATVMEARNPLDQRAVKQGMPRLHFKSPLTSASGLIQVFKTLESGVH
jgi:hypothetical protein